MNTYKVLIPEYLLDFQCTGNDCPDNCCKCNWYINIDHKTYKKYKNSKDRELSRVFKDHLRRNKKETSKINYARLDFKDQCPLLTEDNLCKIHSMMGANALSDTCAMYPRNINIVYNSLEESGTLSCPVITELALLNPKGVDFTFLEIPEGSIRKHYISGAIVEDTDNPASITNYYHPIRMLSIKIIQDRSISLEERLFILGSFTNKLNEAKDKGQSEIAKVIDSYNSILESQAMSELYSQLPTNLNLQLEMLKFIIDSRIEYIDDGDISKFILYFNQLIESLGDIDNNGKVELSANKYVDNYTKYYLPFLNDYGYILENYIVNHIFKDLYPLSNSDNLFDAYVNLNINFNIIKMMLIGMSAYHQKLTIDMAINLIQSFSKYIEHNIPFIKLVLNYLDENEYNTLSYMTVLTKNQ